MHCYICNEEIKSNQSRVCDWIDDGAHYVHRKCYNNKHQKADPLGSDELACCAAIGDFVTVRMSRGAYRLKLTTQEQADIVNNELLTQSGWGLIKSPN